MNSPDFLAQRNLGVKTIARLGPEILSGSSFIPPVIWTLPIPKPNEVYEIRTQFIFDSLSNVTLDIGDPFFEISVGNLSNSMAEVVWRMFNRNGKVKQFYYITRGSTVVTTTHQGPREGSVYPTNTVSLLWRPSVNGVQPVRLHSMTFNHLIPEGVS
jgi:hypothetical protein